jgi:hypothetical protein
MHASKTSGTVEGGQNRAGLADKKSRGKSLPITATFRSRNAKNRLRMCENLVSYPL